MIVKNEESNLETCLKNVQPFVDQIVVVDTGSSDQTKEIAYQFTNDVYDFVWCDDFSKARNFSLDQATNDWVLILDADEVVVDFDKNACVKSINEHPNQVGRIKRINPFESNGMIQKYIERVNRVFNKNFYQYEGKIHEQIVRKDQKPYDTFLIDLSANHIGYMKEVVKTTNKLKRNIEMLTKAIESTPTDPYLHYQIGKSYYMEHTYNEAYSSFKRALEIGVDFTLEYTKDLIESFGYTLIQCQKYSEALEISQYEIYYANSPNYNFLMGLIYMNNGAFHQAIEFFKKCIGSIEGSIEGINSYQPNYNIGVIYEVLGAHHQALYYYAQAGGYSLALERSQSLKNQIAASFEKELNEVQEAIIKGNTSFARIMIDNLKAINDSNQLKIYLGMVDIIDGDYSEGIKVLKEAFEVKSDDYDIAYNIALAYYQLNEFGEALEWLNCVLKGSSDINLMKDTQELMNQIVVLNKN